MQVLVVVVSALGGMALMFFASARTLPSATLPWQIVACVVYLVVATWAMFGSGGTPTWAAALLLGGGVGVLAPLLVAGRRPRSSEP